MSSPSENTTEKSHICCNCDQSFHSAYFIRTIPNIGKEPKQLDDVVRTEFIPATTGEINCSDLERKVLSFPAKLGGFGIPIFSETVEREYNFPS